MLILLSPETYAQSQLHIEKPGKVKRIKLPPGTLIKFQLKNDDRVYKKEIVGFRDSTIVFKSYEVNLDDIGMIRIPLHPRLKKYSEVFIAAGGILFLADQINNSVVDDNDPSLNRGVSIVSLSLISSGIIFRFLQKRTYRFPGKRKLKII